MVGGLVLATVAILAGLWVLAISPKRSESSSVRENVAAQQVRVTAAQSQLATYQASHQRFPGLLAELKRLDVAVPARGAIADLLRELQRRAKVRDSDLRVAALKTPAAVAGATPVTPGATAGPDGLSALPFTFEYTGKYFDLLAILRTVRQGVSVNSGDLKISGRLLTIDGLTFNRAEPGSSVTKAVINATAYIAPDGAPQPQVPAGAATPGGS